MKTIILAVALAAVVASAAQASTADERAARAQAAQAAPAARHSFVADFYADQEAKLATRLGAVAQDRAIMLALLKKQRDDLNDQYVVDQAAIIELKDQVAQLQAKLGAGPQK